MNPVLRRIATIWHSLAELIAPFEDAGGERPFARWILYLR